jgi:hypothetical protein
MLGPATTMWNDYLGTAAADDADALPDTRSLYELAGLDRDRWTIVTIDLDRGAAGQRVTVYAVDREQIGTSAYAHFQQVLDSDGSLPVTAFHLEDAGQVENFANEAFRRVVVRLSCRALSDTALSIEKVEHVGPQQVGGPAPSDRAPKC